MSDNWGMSDKQAALPAEAISNNQGFGDSNGDVIGANSNDAADVSTTTKDDDRAKAREEVKKAGWVEPERYDYTSMTAIDREHHWGSAGKVYHWDGQEGDLGPEFPELEVELFGPEEDRKMQTGHDFTA
jgi:hypothetical protein